MSESGAAEDRFCPICDEQGEQIAFPTLATWCLMNYAGDEESAKSATVLLSFENYEIQAERQVGYSRVARLVNKDVVRGLMIGRMVGNILVQVQQNIAFRGQPEINKAIFSVSEWASTTKTFAGKDLPSDASRLRKEFKRYRDVSHLWAAFELLTDEVRERLFEGREEWDLFLLLAYAYERFIDDERPFEWRPWRIPPSALDDFKGMQFNVNVPPENDWVRKKLSEYRSDHIR
ncbi:hypothetical protein P1J78_18260 [Psychromarinibacter sp. C21-152]|uniref:Uncharacterized protein n=1 Tax=Psychromarinibacter sediminicola TaxID=3033385 RepID=A0AAE3NXX6_9RHOB|nr:hypothetical protein [Psychromarinibacter sediminicola]MDF0602687.1 hypothetical protein [Psychromarinibacter sediminicola]